MSDPVRIILLIVVLALVIGGGVAIYYQFFDKKEGTKCIPKDPVEHATSYEYDSEKECIAMTCESGYAIVGNSCESTAPAAGSAPSSTDSPLDSSAAAVSAPACSQFFTISDSCHETDKSGIKWNWNTEAGDTSTEAATCRNQVDYYEVEAVSEWDPNLTLATKITGKNSISAGLSGFSNFFDGKAMTFRVMPKNAAGENLVAPVVPEQNVDPTAISCSTKGINITPMAPNWNNNKNMLAADVYLEEAPLSYESLTTRDANGKIASDYGSGSGNVTGKKTHSVQVPLGGSITSDCDGDNSGTFTLSWDTISKNTNFDITKKLRVVGDCDYASGDGRQFKNISFT
jgi:hypothetical protein